MSNRAFQYRIYPNKQQKIFFAKTFGCCRKVYNLMLADKIQSYENNKTFGKQTPAMYKEAYPYLKEVDSLALANVQLHLQQAIKNCFQSKHCIQIKEEEPSFIYNEQSKRNDSDHQIT